MTDGERLDDLFRKRIRVEMLMEQTEADSGESEIDFQRRKRAVIDAFHAECGLLPYNLAETQRLPEKRTESQITEKTLNEVLAALIKYFYGYALIQFKAGCEKATFIAAAFKQARMATSLLSPAMIEAALTIITRRIDEFAALKDLPFVLTFTDDSDTLLKGVREFIVTTKDGIHLNESNQPGYETRDSFD